MFQNVIINNIPKLYTLTDKYKISSNASDNNITDIIYLLCIIYLFY